MLLLLLLLLLLEHLMDILGLLNEFDHLLQIC